MSGSLPEGMKKDQKPLARELIRRGYQIGGNDGNEHFPVTWQGRLVTAFANSPRNMGGSLQSVRAEVQRFERAMGLDTEITRRPKMRRGRKAPEVSGFVMPAGAGNDKRPASLAPSQYTVATLLGANAMRDLARAVLPSVTGKETVVTQREEWRHNPRRQWTDEEKTDILRDYDAAVSKNQGTVFLADNGLHHSNISSWRKQLASRPVPVVPAEQGYRSWTEEEMAAIVFRYRKATQAWRAWNSGGRKGDKPQSGVALLKELGVGNGHITWFTQKLLETGRYPELGTTEVTDVVPAAEVIIPFETVPASAEVLTAGIVVTGPVMDADEEIEELTATWSALVARKRDLAGQRDALSEQIDDLLNQSYALSEQRDKLLVEQNDVQADIAKARKRLADLVSDER